jgi:hypothetical protein
LRPNFTAAFTSAFPDQVALKVRYGGQKRAMAAGEVLQTAPSAYLEMGPITYGEPQASAPLAMPPNEIQ